MRDIVIYLYDDLCEIAYDGSTDTSIVTIKNIAFNAHNGECLGESELSFSVKGIFDVEDGTMITLKYPSDEKDGGS